LIAHQRNQGRNDDGNSLPAEGRQLETQTFATACWHNRERIFAAKNGFYDVLLPRAKGRESKNGRKKLGRAWRCVGHGPQDQKMCSIFYESFTLTAREQGLRRDSLRDFLMCFS
jgi:hypothetical protein